MVTRPALHDAWRAIAAAVERRGGTPARAWLCRSGTAKLRDARILNIVIPAKTSPQGEVSRNGQAGIQCLLKSLEVFEGPQALSSAVSASIEPGSVIIAPAPCR